MEILKRAQEFQSGEGISAFESEANVREEVNRRSFKAGYTDRDGQPRNGKGDAPRPVSRMYSENYIRLYGEPKLNLWPRDKQGKLID